MDQQHDNSVNSSMPESKTVRGYTVKKLPLGAYFSLLSKLDNVPRSFLNAASQAWSELDKANSDAEAMENNAKFFEVALKLVSRFPEEILGIVAQACDEDKEVLQNDRNLGLDGFAELAVAVYEVNDLGSVYEKVKKKLPDNLKNYVKNLMTNAKTGSTK